MQFDCTKGINAEPGQPLCPVDQPMHVLQRLLHDVGRVVSVSAATTRVVQAERASKTGEVLARSNSSFEKNDDKYNEELAAIARSHPGGPPARSHAGGPPARSRKR